MLRLFAEICGLAMVGYGAYVLGYREGKEASEGEAEKAFEMGMKTGFMTAPDIYREMVKNGDIDDVPEGMNIGEVGKVFSTLDEAKTARFKHQMESGLKNKESILIFQGNDDLSMFYILVDKDRLRKG